MRKFFYKSGLNRLRNVLSPDLRKKVAEFKKPKNKGMVILIPTIILSGLILMVALGLSQVLMTELEFSADLLFSEKAYFAAESGVEKSLLALKDKPLNWVDEEGSLVGTNANYDLLIANSVPSFGFSLAKNETVKFRLGVDTDEGFNNYNILTVNDFEITPKEEDLSWKIICQKQGKTVALQGDGGDFTKGQYDNGDLIESMDVATFLNGNNSLDNICFMSLTNLIETEDKTIEGTVTATSIEKLIAPAKVSIRAVGKSYHREKIVTFEYLQKNLSSVFNLGFYYTTEEEESEEEQ